MKVAHHGSAMGCFRIDAVTVDLLVEIRRRSRSLIGPCQNRVETPRIVAVGGSSVRPLQVTTEPLSAFIFLNSSKSVE